SALMESGADFVCCDNPHATKLMLHVMAAFAEHEREQASQRTKAALAAAKARGVKLGNPRWEDSIAKARAAKGDMSPAPEVCGFMCRLRDEGNCLREIANELNRLGIRSPQQKQWYASTIRNQLSAYNDAA